MISTSRQLLLSALLFTVTAAATPALALSVRSYDGASVRGLVSSGKPVVVHVYAGWCLQCRAQASILSSLASSKSYAGITVYRIESSSKAAEELGVSRSTMIAYQGGKEVSRMSWGTSTASVEGVLKALK